MASFLKLHKPTSASFKLLCCSSPLSAFTELNRVRALLWIRLWLKWMLWLVWLLPRPLKLSAYQQWGCFTYHLCVQWSSAFNFLQGLFLRIHNLANWHKRPSFQPILAFDMPSLCHKNCWNQLVKFSATAGIALNSDLSIHEHGIVLHLFWFYFILFF